MPSTSKSNRRKQKKSKFIPKAKQQWQVKQPTRNWLELPEDVMANILCRVGLFDILENAQKVCTAWRKICKDPAMWRIICIDSRPPFVNIDDRKATAMWKNAVDRSQGQLIDITMVDVYDELLHYVVDRSRQLRRLEVAFCYYSDTFMREWSEILKKFPLLEELNLYSINISKEDIETIGRYCPMLKTLKVNQEACTILDRDNDEVSKMKRNEIAIAIGENIHELEHLELIGNSISSIGLQVILDGCRHLKSLDLRRCLYIDLEGDLGKRCSEQIKGLKLPNDSTEGCPYIYENGYKMFDDSDYDYDDYDDFTDYDYDDYDDYVHDLVDMNEMLALMDMFG